MNRHIYKPTCAFRFRRFCRAKWAAYSSMHREVTIGRLAARVADSSLAKGAATLALAITLSQGNLMAQSDDDRETRTLPEVTITLGTDSLAFEAEPAAVLTADDFQQSTIHSIGDLVAQLPGVDLRVRGGGDVQGDLSMRGGTFDQMLILLGGINLTDAQTGHHSLDIPIDITMVERVELLTPAQCMARGIVAFCGAVNIIVCEQYRDRLLADISGGSYGSANASLLGTKALGHWSLTGAAAYHFGNKCRMEEVIKEVPKDALAMGNLDPVSLFKDGTPAQMREATLDLLEKMREHPNFVLSSGCDTPPHTPIENVNAFFEALNEWNKEK